MYNLLKSLIVLALICGCQQAEPSKTVPVAEKLEPTQNQTQALEYIAQFDSAGDAEQHVKEVRAIGGQARTLRNSDKIVAASLSAEQTKQVRVPEQTTVAKDATIKIKPQQRATAVTDAAELADNVMTAKGVVGVNELQSRFPEADGRGVVVAVFDTGIDFGLQGVSDGSGDERKLLGFYDMTDFGRVKFADDQRVTDASATTLKIGDQELRIAKSMEIKRVFATGVLSEKKLAAEYLAPHIDLNNNGKFSDTYTYVVGENSRDQLAVWVDVDGDGQIKDADTEELTDFNKTGKFILLRSDTSPAGAKPLAVSIISENEIQFHSVEGGHGTSCAIVIGGDAYANGYLKGMAPKVKFLSYMLDVSGQDVYTMSQFMDMFLHARDQKVDAISISWGFTVSNLQSARYFAKFLDEEIASKGIVIGIANGNEGPAYSSGYTTDYIPHHGFAVGAMVSADQAKNVYGWNGDVEDSVIWYSSFGPTRGGRQVPDVISPLMTMVRGERTAQGEIFKGFGGTSSATPALIGAVSSVMSKVKADGLSVNARLLKMAVQNTAAPIAHVDENRQGKGVINVNKAYDLYVKLLGELEAAQKDSSKSTRFPYELRASTKISGLAEAGEGLVIDGFEASKTIAVNLMKTSADLIDLLNFAEPLQVRHSEDFFTTNDSILMQATGAKFSVQFDSAKLHLPGTYTDSIELVRPEDGVVLLSVPVVVRVPYRVSQNAYQIDSVNTEMNINDQWRSVIHLTEGSALTFEGAAIDRQGGFGTYLGVFVQSDRGDIVYQNFISMKQSVTPLSLTTPVLPVGKYEIVLFRGASRPAVVTNIHVTGAWRKPDSKVLATEVNGNSARVLLTTQKAAGAAKAKLVFKQAVHTVALKKDLTRPRKGFYGELEAELSGDLGVHVMQSEISRSTEEFLNVSMAINNLSDAGNMYRGWINFWDRGAPMQHISLEGKASKVEVLAYPNIVNWDMVTTDVLYVELHADLAEAVESAEATLTKELATTGQAVINFEFQNGNMPAAGIADLILMDKEGKELEKIRVELK